MKAVVQRVSSAEVSVDGKVVGRIGRGICVLLGIAEGDTDTTMRWMAERLVKLRIFPDDDGKMNLSVLDVGGEVMIVSQFTLYGDVNKGFRPSFITAARPDFAQAMYDRMIEYISSSWSLSVQSGEFGADMQVSLVNDGPVTIIIEK